MNNSSNDVQSVLEASAQVECELVFQKTIASPFRFWLVVVGGGCVCSFGLICNSLLLIALVHQQRGRHPSSDLLYYTCLCVYDVLVAVCYLLLYGVHGAVHPISLHNMQSAILIMRFWWATYVYSFIVSRLCLVASAYTVVFASVERVLVAYRWGTARCWPLWRVFLCTVALFLAAIFTLPFYFEFKLVNGENCTGLNEFEVHMDEVFLTKHTFYNQWFRVHIRSLFIILLPFSMLIGLNCMIVRKAKQQSILVVHVSAKKRAVRSATRTLVAIVSTYLIGNSVNVVLSLCEVLWLSALRQSPQLHMCVSDIVTLLTVLVGATRLLVYLVFNHRIRDSLYQLIQDKVQSSFDFDDGRSTREQTEPLDLARDGSRRSGRKSTTRSTDSADNMPLVFGAQFSMNLGSGITRTLNHNNHVIVEEVLDQL